jgi:uncharacterized protein (TIGR03435 family)
MVLRNLLLLGLMIASATLAQEFEVASIKPHAGDIAFSADPAVRGSHVVGTACTLLDMITNAYSVRYDQVTRGPSWLRTDHFDIEAKAASDVPLTPEQAKLMMRKLLAERFGLRLHNQTKDAPVYFLVMATSGPKLKASLPDAPASGFTRGTARGMHMEDKKGTMQKLALQLSNSAGRPVLDKTGLTGTYDYTLDWFPANRIPDPDSDVPSLFNAVQEQLGLRLESGTAPQLVIVIDSVEKLVGN